MISTRLYRELHKEYPMQSDRPIQLSPKMVRLENEARHGTLFQRVAIASNVRTSRPLLRILSEDTAPAVLAALIGNPTTPQELISEISTKALRRGSEWWMVHAALAGHYTTSADVLWSLYNKGEWCVVLSVIQHQNCPVEILKRIAELPKMPYAFNQIDLNREIRVIARQRLGVPLSDEDY